MQAHEVEARADAIEARLALLGTSERARGEKRYLKSDLDFLGATMPQVRAAVKAAVGEMPDLGHDELVGLASALWSHPVHERRMAAVVALELRRQLLGSGDLPFLEGMLRDSRTWALVDGMAVGVVGAILAADESRTIPVLDRWATDADFWIRRSALLAWLRPLRAGAPLERFLAYAEAMLEEKEFFIRKAIGWVLREVGQRRPDEVVVWLAPRAHRASGVTMREAVRHLPDAERDRLLRAYRDRRPAL